MPSYVNHQFKVAKQFDLASAMLNPFEDNARARETVTNTSILGKHGRGSETSLETGDKRKDGRAASSQAFGLRFDFDIPKQVSLSVYVQQMTRLYNPCKHMAEQNGHVQLRPSRTSNTRTFVQLCHKRGYRTNYSLQPYKGLCLFVCL